MTGVIFLLAVSALLGGSMVLSRDAYAAIASSRQRDHGDQAGGLGDRVAGGETVEVRDVKVRV